MGDNRHMRFKENIRNWLGLEGPITRQEREIWYENQVKGLKSQLKEQEGEIRECMKFIGALYEHLQVRPQRTFVEDFSRLPEEQKPTMEVIKVVKAKAKV